MEFWRNLKLTRHVFGGIESSGGSYAVVASGATISFHSYSGPGYFYYVQMRVPPNPESEELALLVSIDGTLLHTDMDTVGNNCYRMLNYMGFDSNTLPIQLLTYNVDGTSTVRYYFNPPLYFDNKLDFSVYNGASNNFTIYYGYFYTKL